MNQTNNNNNDLNRPFKCSECSKRFLRKGTLIQHERIHTGIKPYICDYCSKKFGQLSHLRQHIARHTGLRPFKCEIGNCNKTFAQKTNLNSHMKTHNKGQQSNDSKQNLNNNSSSTTTTNNKNQNQSLLQSTHQQLQLQQQQQAAVNSRNLVTMFNTPFPIVNNGNQLQLQQLQSNINTMAANFSPFNNSTLYLPNATSNLMTTSNHHNLNHHNHSRGL
jgi:DNA-directed RNA polymerase subunit RPC12/RpoP